MTNFERFYITWYSRAIHFAREYVLSESDAENIVQRRVPAFIRIKKYYSLHAIRNPTLPTIGMLRHVLCRKPKTIRVAISLQRKW